MKKIKIAVLAACMAAVIGVTGCEAVENSYNERKAKTNLPLPHSERPRVQQGL